MAEISLEDIYALVAEAVPAAPSAALTGSEDLTALGIDSLTVLAILVSAAGQYALDLAELPEDLPPPRTISDLFQLLKSLPSS